MNPTRLRLRNVRRFPDLDIRLPEGTVALVGANGAGKSSILNAIDTALFAERGELADLITTGEDNLEIELTFEHAGELYRVRRQVRGRKSPTVDFERRLDTVASTRGPYETDELWEPLTRENAAATQQLICDTLGLTRKTFRASSFLKQADTAAFTEADPAARKALLAEILRLQLWDDSDGRKPATTASLLGLARQDLKTAEDKLPVIQARIEACDQAMAGRELAETTLEELRLTLAGATAELATFEQRLDEAQAAKTRNAAAVERLRAARAELATATADHQRVTRELQEAVDADERRSHLQEQLNEAAARAGEIPALEQQVEQHRARAIKTAERDQANREADQHEEHRGRVAADALELRRREHQLRAKAVELLDNLEDAGECDRCGQTLGAQAARRAADSYRAEAVELAEKANKLDEEAAAIAVRALAAIDRAAAIEIPDVDGDPVEIQSRLVEARAAAERRAQLAEQLRQAAEKAAHRVSLAGAAAVTDANLAAAKAAVDAASLEVGDEEKLAGDERLARAGVEMARHRETETREAIARVEQSLELTAKAQQDKDALLDEQRTVQTEVEGLRRAVAAYGRNGIPALIVEAVAVPQIETEANRLLELMPTADGATLQVQLRTQRELKASDELRDTLDIVVFDGEHERAYETFSEGEKGRINLCLRIALARLLARRRGAESRLLAIDELPFLDAAAQDQLVDVVNAAAADFDRVVVVGHSETFQQSFDQTISVVKRGGRSFVDGERERVAA